MRQTNALSMLQVVNFLCSKAGYQVELLRAMNRLLPADIRILNVDPIPMSFSARYR